MPEPVAAGKPTISSKQGPATTGETATAPEATTTGVAAVGEAATLPAGEAEALRAVVRLEGAPSWLRIEEDGQTVLEQTSEPGFSQEFEADRAISIHTGNASAVRVEIDGQDQGILGASGEVVVRTYTPEA